jgi:hypothetical protein
VVSLQEPPRPRVLQLSCHRRRRGGCLEWSSLAIGGGGAAHQGEVELTREAVQLREGGATDP